MRTMFYKVIDNENELNTIIIL